MAALDNPIISSPFKYPTLHWALNERGMPTGETVPGRRVSSYIVPIPKAKRSAGQAEFEYDIEGSANVKTNDLVNRIRDRVDEWRKLPAAQSGVTYETARLLEHWRRPVPDRKPLFFCQVEAAETIIWLTEVAPKNKAFQDLANAAEVHSEAANPGLFRLAMKLATGAGKTTVMAMLIAWHTVNKARRPNSKMFTDAFLIVAPGITIKDRLRVLLPESSDSIYERLSIVPRDMMPDLHKARIVITNYHCFQRRKQQLAKGTAEVLRGRETAEEFDNRFRETDGQMVQRVMGSLMGRRGIIVINDEAHHCYQEKPKTGVGAESETQVNRAAEETAAEAKADAEQNNEAARLWINGIRAVQSVLEVKAIYDLSATPFFLRGSGYREGELFGWVVSDFSLMDAIESGIVKVPRVPTRDDVIQAQEPIFRHIYKHVRTGLSRRGRRSGGGMAASDLPEQLEAALQALYRDYEKTDAAWAGKSETPPVFIVVCNNTTTSKMVYEWIAGYCENPNEEDETKLRSKTGNLDLFNNVKDGKPLPRRRTILIDSAQLESGDALSDSFREVAREEIEAFKKELRQRDPSRDVEKIEDAELLREVMNTVGRKGKLGEQVRCIVSVSMLTEGWDANTVTDVLGCRAFGTQLLCEQVVGRALRRVSYDADDQGMFRPEYAEVLGVPFSFMPANSEKDFKPPKERYRVYAEHAKTASEIKFPRLDGYRVEFPKGKLTARFTSESHMTLSALWPEIPDKTETDPLVGRSNVLKNELGDIREQTVAFMLAKRTLEKWSRLSGESNPEPVTLFPQFLSLAKQWIRECPFTVESLSPHRVLAATDDDPGLLASIRAEDADDHRVTAGRKEASQESARQQSDDFARVVLTNLEAAGVGNTKKGERLRFTKGSMRPASGRYINAKAEYREQESEDAPIRKAAIFIGPEYGTVSRQMIVAAAKEAIDVYDILIVCGFAFEAHATGDTISTMGSLPILRVNMNQDLRMADRLKAADQGNLFVVFGEPDIAFRKLKDGRYECEIKGLDIFNPNTGELKPSGPEDIACWFLDTDYDEGSFFVRHAYFLGAKDPFDKLRRALQSEINLEAWETLNSAVSFPFKSSTGKIAVKAINHYGDEVLKVFDVKNARED